jgi:adenine-specific DNA methylase
MTTTEGDMSSDKHTSGNLLYTESVMDTLRGDIKCFDIFKQIGECTTEYVCEIIDEADARRLVACWNAFVGTPTEIIERAQNGLAVLHHEFANERATLQQQNRELVEALKGIRDHCPCDPDTTNKFYAAWQKMLEAIAKGEQPCNTK